MTLGVIVGGLLLSSGALSGAGLAVASVARSGSNVATTPDPSPDPLSAVPKTVVLDPSTGTVESVTAGEPAAVVDAVTPAIASSTYCGPGDGCYYTPTVNSTYHDRSFYGTPGTFSGSWPRRDAWQTGNYTASVCWQGGCSQFFGPNTYLTFGGALVTGTSFTIQ